MQLLEKLLEKRDVMPGGIANLAAQHGTERMHKVAEDTRMEREASTPPLPPPKNNGVVGPADLVNTGESVSTAAGMM